MRPSTGHSRERKCPLTAGIACGVAHTALQNQAEDRDRIAANSMPSNLSLIASRVARRACIVALFLSASVVAGVAQDSALKAWLAVPPGQAGIVISFGFPVSSATISSAGKILATKKWASKQQFVWQLRLQPDIYQIQFAQSEPLASVGVIAQPASSLTYVRLVPLQEDNGQIVGAGVAVTRGQPPELTQWLQNAAATGIADAFGTNLIEAGHTTLVVSTEPFDHR
jgi:hypothetical protein